LSKKNLQSELFVTSRERLPKFVASCLLEVRLGSIPLKKGGGCDSEIVVFQSVWLVGLKIMMGHQQVEQVALFYEFSLEKHSLLLAAAFECAVAA
jgi:hypothetical protein